MSERPHEEEIFTIWREGLKGTPGGGSGGPNGPSYSYSFHGDPHAMFAEFFRGRNPFDSFFGRGEMRWRQMTLSPGSAWAALVIWAASQGCPGQREVIPKKPDPPVIRELPVSLEEIYTGCTKKMKISHKRLGPDGRSVHTEDKILTIQVKKGWKEGTKITFPKEGDETPNNIPADIVFVLKDKPHSVFKRDSSNLIYTSKISLREALCGYSITVPTLDGRNIPLVSKDIVNPGTKRKIHGEGLPLPKAPEQRGDLVVEFDIRFPQRLPASSRETLERVLPA
ncbi:unnamed protein product [Ranitomeya imitator]|uniref:Chaperone DnaJ C-terminal domain-containing protein n=1 Tax=Ranitomeya imitator TaxID=111125 RepID=A0ABN9L2U2_9NEOB|nr:unnamed protein product [Ranitomeya imitator]